MENDKIKKFVEKWMQGHEPDTFVKNEHGIVMYTDKHSSLNLTIFFENLLEDYVVSLPDPTPQQTVTAEKILRKHIPPPTNNGELNDDVNIINAMEEFAQLRVDEAVREIESKLKERKEWALNIRDNDESNMRIEEIDLALYYVTKK